MQNKKSETTKAPVKKQAPPTKK